MNSMFNFIHSTVITIADSIAAYCSNDTTLLDNAVENQVEFDYYFSKNRIVKITHNVDKNRIFLRNEIIKKLVLLDAKNHKRSRKS